MKADRDDKRKYWLWLSHSCGQGSRCAVSLVRSFGGAAEIFSSDSDDLADCGVRIDKNVLSRLLEKNTSEEEEILAWCDANAVTVLTPEDSAYPPSLRLLRDAPMVLYTIGSLPSFEVTLCCAVVGTRTMTDYGRRMAYDLGRGLAAGGACLVSGLALGIDGMAMAGAVEAGGATVAVLGCGIDVVYPKEHEKLLRRVLEKGAVITEYAPGVSPAGNHFPVRNRLISGLSQAVCVVEGSMKSGSLITARHALYQGRDLFAVPGRVGESGAAGTNHLIKEGANAVTGASDILEKYEFLYPHSVRVSAYAETPGPETAEEELGIGRRGYRRKRAEKQTEKAESPKKAELFPEEKKENAEKPEKVKIDLSVLSEDDKKVFDFMKPDVPMLPDEMIGCGLPLRNIMVSLTMLEINGAVEAGAGGYFLRRAADSGDDIPYVTEEDESL